MTHIILEGYWCGNIALNVHELTKDKSEGTEDSFYGSLEHAFNQFPKYHMNILLGDFNAKLGREDIFKPAIVSKSLHESKDGNGVKEINIATSKNLVVRSTMFPHSNIHK